MAKSYKSKRTPSAKGQLILELCSTCIFLVVFVIVSVDIGFLLYGAHINDKACRDACRAAAQASDSTNALRMAQTALYGQRLVGDTVNQSIVTRPSLPAGGVTYVDFNGHVSPDESPYVTVTTVSKSTLPFGPPSFLGQTMPNSITFTQTYTFPIVRIRQLL